MAEQSWKDDPFRACRDVDTNIFFAGGAHAWRAPAASTAAGWEKAKEVCRTCPVMEQCRDASWGEEHGVWGGTDPWQRHLFRRALRKSAAKWPVEKRRRYGAEVYRLRSGPHPWDWTAIRTKTALVNSLAKVLYDEYLEYLAEQAEQQAAKAPPPKAVSASERPLFQPFPEKAGRKDMWVRNHGFVQDAYYRAQTPQGDWFLVETRALSSQTIKWVRAEDVRLHHPVQVHIREYVGRSGYVARNIRRQRAEAAEAA